MKNFDHYHHNAPEPDCSTVPEGFYPEDDGLHCDICYELVGSWASDCEDHHCIDCYYCGEFDECICGESKDLDEFLDTFFDDVIPPECVEVPIDFRPGDIGHPDNLKWDQT